MTIWILIIAVCVGIALFEVLYTRSHAKNLREYSRRLDEIYGVKREDDER